MMMSTKMLVLKTSLVVGVDALKALVARNDAVPFGHQDPWAGTHGQGLPWAGPFGHQDPNPAEPSTPVSDSGDERIDDSDDFELQWALQESAWPAEQRGKQIPNLSGDEVEQNNHDAVQAVKDLVLQGSSEIDAINFIALELRKNAHELQLAYVLNVSKEPNMAKEESVDGVRLQAADDEQRILEAQLVVLKCVNDYDKNHSSSVGEDNIFTTCVEEVEKKLLLPVGILCALQPDLALQLALEQTHDRYGMNINIDQEWENVVKVAERFGLKDSDFQFAEFLQLLERGGHKL